MSLFDPTAKANDKAEKAKKRKVLADIKNWSLSMIPAGDLHEGYLRFILSRNLCYLLKVFLGLILIFGYWFIHTYILRILISIFMWLNRWLI